MSVELDEEELPAEVAIDPEPALAKVDSQTLELPKAWLSMTAAEKREHVQDHLMQRSSEILDAALSFSEVSPADEEPPEHWVRELGREKAEQRFRIAKAAWENSKSAPFGISVAKNLFAAITKIDAARAQPQTSLNAAVQININPPQFEEIDVE